MKVAFVFATVLGALALTGPALVMEPPSGDADMSPPSWLQLPNAELVAQVEFTGSASAPQSQGSVLLELLGDGQLELAWLQNSYAMKGYVVTHEFRGMDSYMASPDVTTVLDPKTGRRITLTRVEQIDGSLLRLTYTDPLARL